MYEQVERLCLLTFYCEGFINLFSGLSLMFFPYFALNSFGVEHVESMAADIMRWFGSVVIILGWIGLFSPVTKGNIQALLLGDIAYIAVFFQFIHNHGSYTLTAQISCLYLVIYLALARVTYLLLLSIKGNENKKQQ